MQRELKYKIWLPYCNMMMQPVSIIYIQESQVSGVTIGQMKRWVWLQYIGRPDKNGNPIYEGDIMKVRLGNGLYGKNRRFQDVHMVVEWNQHEAGFSLQYRGEYGICNQHDGDWSAHEIVGNIYQHPELLTQPVS